MILYFKNVARIFDLEGGKPQITCNDVIKIFLKEGLFMGQIVKHLTRVS